jgi:AraC-like DNA-binding protein
MSDKAKRATISLGDLEVDGFQMPDGSYRMSITGAAAAVNLTVSNASDFLRSKALKSILGNQSTPRIIDDVEVESSPDQLTGQTRIRALPLEVVNAYWHWQSHRGNKQALSLCIALSAETLDRRFDDAFGVQRSEAERNQRLSQRIQQLSRDLKQLGEAYAEPDDLRTQVAYLETQIRQMGGEPWQLPAPEQADDGE